MDIKWIDSPNFWQGRKSYKPEAIVIHIMAGTLTGTDSWFKNPKSQVSAHYGIGKNGEVHQYVKEEDRAWHAGGVYKPTWKLIKKKWGRVVNPNNYTIGIEHEGRENTVWSEEMKNASSQLIRELAKRWQIPLDRDHIIGHYEITARKPYCPAVDKNIINELIERAKQNSQPSVPPQVEAGINKIEQGLAEIKQVYN